MYSMHGGEYMAPDAKKKKTKGLGMRNRFPGPFLSAATESRLGDDELLAIGYPSDSHGVPVITIDCGKPSFIAHHDLSSRCPVLGGMSGGPVLSEAGGQVGIVSLSAPEENDRLTFPSFFSAD
ncbi:MAG: hypothetical protein HYV97_03860 [Bdellovibrio sp.]|nr:hypothetical protein [Bdellovibrio sp.]